MKNHHILKRGLFLGILLSTIRGSVTGAAARSNGLQDVHSKSSGGGGNAVKTGTQVWCVAKPHADQGVLQNGLNFACGEGGADCSAIQPNGACFTPNTLIAHASYAFNSYYQRKGRNYWNCYFQNAALLVVTDPSYGSCVYPAK